MARVLRTITVRQWAVLFFVCCLVFGCNFSYDIPSAISTPLQVWLGLGDAAREWTSKKNLLYSVFALPNIFLPLVGGVLIDRAGTRVVLLVCSFFVAVGQALFATGVAARSFVLMVVGRILVGLCAESMDVGLASITTAWFQRGGLSFANGVQNSFAGMSLAAADFLLPRIAAYNRETGDNKTTTAVWLSFGISIIAVFAAVVVVFLNRTSSRSKAGIPLESAQEKRMEQAQPGEGAAFAQHADNMSPRHSITKRRLSRKRQTPMLSITTPAVETKTATQQLGSPVITSHVPQGRVEGKHHSPSAHPVHNSVLKSPTHISDQYLSPRSMKEHAGHSPACSGDRKAGGVYKIFAGLREFVHFPRTFWLLCAYNCALSAATSPFFHICTEFFELKYYDGDPAASEKAGILMAIPDVVSLCCAPVFGLIIDKVGRRGSLLPLSGILIAAAHCLMLFTSLSPVVAMVLIGIAVSTIGLTLWPCVPFLIAPEQLATAFGVVTVTQNTALTVTPLLVSEILAFKDGPVPREERIREYRPALLFFIGIAALGTACAFALHWMDINAGGLLEKVSLPYANTAVARDGGAGMSSGKDSGAPAHAGRQEADMSSMGATRGDGIEGDAHVQSPAYYVDEDTIVVVSPMARHSEGASHVRRRSYSPRHALSPSFIKSPTRLHKDEMRALSPTEPSRGERAESTAGTTGGNATHEVLTMPPDYLGGPPVGITIAVERTRTIPRIELPELTPPSSSSPPPSPPMPSPRRRSNSPQHPSQSPGRAHASRPSSTTLEVAPDYQRHLPPQLPPFPRMELLVVGPGMTILVPVSARPRSA